MCVCVCERERARFDVMLNAVQKETCILIGTRFYSSVIRNMAHESFLAWSAWA